MFEKEIKILEIDKDELVTKLKDFWAVIIFDDMIHDVYYDYPEWKIDEEKRSFRIRKKWNCFLYTIKKKEKSTNIKICQEKELEVTNVEWFKKTLEKYGLIKSREKQKHRTSYEIDW